MSWFRTMAACTLAAGALLLNSGCDGRKQVALSAKDDTIRRDQELLAQNKDQNDKLTDLNGQLADQNKQLAEKNAQVELQTQAQIAELKGIVGTLKLEQQNGQITDVNRKGGAIHITVAGSALFDPGQAALKKSSSDMLRKIASTLKTKYPGNYVRIEGHTDGTPIAHSKDRFKDNMALSVARAQAVYAGLVKLGIPSSKLYTAGYGEHQPLVYPEKTAADRAKNRRVEIVIMPSDVKVEKEPLAMAGKSSGKSASKK